MTSEFTLGPTEKFFKENNYFGLEPSNMVMFEQRMIPAVTFDGKVILQSKGKLAMAPGRLDISSVKYEWKHQYFHLMQLMYVVLSVRWEWWSVPGVGGQQGTGGHGEKRSGVPACVLCGQHPGQDG